MTPLPCRGADLLDPAWPGLIFGVFCDLLAIYNCLVVDKGTGEYPNTIREGMRT